MTVNDIAYRQLVDELPKRYPHMQFVAFSEGAIVDDDADFYALHHRIRTLPNRMVVRVGDVLPEYMDIL